MNPIPLNQVPYRFASVVFQFYKTVELIAVMISVSTFKVSGK